LDSTAVRLRPPPQMEIIPHQYLDIRIENTREVNEVAIFGEITRKCLALASKVGLKNTFTDEEKALIVRMANGLGIEQEETLYD